MTRSGPAAVRHDVLESSQHILRNQEPECSLESRSATMLLGWGGSYRYSALNLPTKDCLRCIQPTAPQQGAIWHLPCCCSAPCWSRCLSDLCQRLAGFMELERSRQAQPRQSRVTWRIRGYRGQAPVLLAAPCQHPHYKGQTLQTLQGLPPAGICIARNMSMVCSSSHQAQSNFANKR